MLEQRLANDPAVRRQVEAARVLWAAGERIGPRWDVDAMWARVKPVDRPAPAPPVLGHAGAQTRSARWRWAAVAAALVLASGMSVWLTKLTTGDEPSPMREVVTAVGQRAEVRLGDGSRVVLGVDSRLRFPVKLDRRSRDVELSGQAYFEVTADPKRPFRVRTGDVITRVLGTEFVVRAYQSDTAVRVAVVSGAVSVSRGAADSLASATLHGGDLATVGLMGVPAVVRGTDVESYLDWTNGRIVFAGTDLAEVARELGRWYGIEIRLGQPALERLRLTASFRNEPVDQVLRLIAASLKLEVERAGEQVTFRAR